MRPQVFLLGWGGVKTDQSREERLDYWFDVWRKREGDIYVPENVVVCPQRVALSPVRREFWDEWTSHSSDDRRSGGRWFCGGERELEGESVWMCPQKCASPYRCLCAGTVTCVPQCPVADHHIHREDVRKVWKECQEQSFWYRGTHSFEFRHWWCSTGLL